MMQPFKALGRILAMLAMGIAAGCNPQRPASTPRPVAEAFGESELWYSVTNEVVVMGIGSTIEHVKIVADSTHSCTADRPGGTVTFDGATLHVTSDFIGASGADCGVDLTGRMTSTAADNPLDLEGSASGHVLVTGTETPVSEMLWLRRSDPCADIPPLGSSELAVYALGSAPLIVVLGWPVPLSLPGDVEFAVIGSGDGSLYGSAALPPDAPDGAKTPYTFSIPAEGSALTVSFEGTTLSMEGEVELTDATTNGGATVGVATVRFSGTVAGCWQINAQGPEQLLRLDGAGHYTIAGREGDWTTLYLYHVEHTAP
jgi:hypothetical protein